MQDSVEKGTPVSAHDWNEEDKGTNLVEHLGILTEHWRLLLAASLGAGVLALGLSYLIPPTYTARTVFLPPQQPQSAAASALASLGALSGLAGGAINVKTTADQYVALMQSANVQDKLVDRFKLMDVYETKYRFQARQTLGQSTRISLGKKDGLITVEVDAKSPQLAADVANQHVAELRRLTGELALTEPQQRRKFFEVELKRSREQLTQAQQALQQSGFNPGALKAEPKAAAETYARIKAEATAAEVKLQTLSRMLANSAPEVQQQQTLLGALRSQIGKLEANEQAGNKADVGYISRYRDYKYQESLFELFSRQYEAARLDESREGGLIQVVDVATPPEYKSKPKRTHIAAGTSAAIFLILVVGLLGRHYRRQRSAGTAQD
jgi:uncharacterized protein involved in exopolysaccharide biosynthesis